MISRELSNKLPRKYENPIDSVFEDISYKLGPPFYQNKFTPNMITTISTIFAIITIYYLNINKFTFAAIFHLLTYLFDCFDGNYARTYNMETRFGDLYDHFKDTIYIIALLFFIIKKNNHSRNNKIIIYTIIAILTIISMIFFGCTEIYTKQNRKELLQSNTLGSFSKLCYDKPHIIFKKFRLLSIGTLSLFLFFLIISFNYTTSNIKIH